MPFRNVRVRLLAGVAAVLLSGSGSVSFAGNSTLVEQRMLSQEGLAIALASTVLQSQLNILITAYDTSSKCAGLAGGTGSIRLHSSKQVNKHTLEAKVTVYFDRHCKMPYVAADATITNSSSSIDITENADYSGPTGDALGQMAIQEKALVDTKSGNLQGVIGLGQFSPSNGAVTVDLGLQCTLADLNTQKRKYTAPCEGGVAQDFPELSRSLASVTPLKLHLKRTDHRNFSVSFAGSKSQMVTGKLGALSITTPTDSSLGIGGPHRGYHNSADTKGFASQFSLFPPTPTDWSITDTQNDAKFAISVTDNTTRNSTGTVTQISTGDVLATFAVDQSGTGSITYSDSSTQPITSWVLAD